MKYLLVVMLYGKVVGYELHYNRSSCAAAYYRTIMKHYTCVRVAGRCAGRWLGHIGPAKESATAVVVRLWGQGAGLVCDRTQPRHASPRRCCCDT